MALETTNDYVEASFTAPSQATDELTIRGKFTFFVRGGATATVELQRSFDEGVTWGIVESHTADVEKNGEEHVSGGVRYRLFCSAHTSGTATVRLQRRGY